MSPKSFLQTKWPRIRKKLVLVQKCSYRSDDIATTVVITTSTTLARSREPAVDIFSIRYVYDWYCIVLTSSDLGNGIKGTSTVDVEPSVKYSLLLAQAEYYSHNLGSNLTANRALICEALYSGPIVKT